MLYMFVIAASTTDGRLIGWPHFDRKKSKCRTDKKKETHTHLRNIEYRQERRRGNKWTDGYCTDTRMRRRSFGMNRWDCKCSLPPITISSTAPTTYEEDDTYIALSAVSVGCCFDLDSYYVDTISFCNHRWSRIHNIHSFSSYLIMLIRATVIDKNSHFSNYRIISIHCLK